MSKLLSSVLVLLVALGTAQATAPASTAATKFPTPQVAPCVCDPELGCKCKAV